VHCSTKPDVYSHAGKVRAAAAAQDFVLEDWTGGKERDGMDLVWSHAMIPFGWGNKQASKHRR